MDFAPLTYDHCSQWASLLADSFERSPDEMAGLLGWLHAGYPLVAWGAWDGERLAAQYSCRLAEVILPGCDTPHQVGMSVNMAVHPDYRGQGLIKHLSQPVYETVRAGGGIAGVGFSNAAGVQVDLRSKSYGYHVVGKLVSTLVWLSARVDEPPLTLTDTWPSEPFATFTPENARIHFAATPGHLRHRFAAHPFRRYQFGVWSESGETRGVVVYRPAKWGMFRGAALLAAYGDDVVGLLRRWSVSLAAEKLHFAHVLTTTHSEIRDALRVVGRVLDVPYTRTPYYLTAKSLGEVTPDSVFEFQQWDCVGGDVL